MNNRRRLVLAAATIGYMIAPLAFGAYKCTTKMGVTYQDKPCMEAPQAIEPIAVASMNGDRTRPAQRATKEPERAVERARLTSVDPRRAEEAAEYEDWQQRSARKSDSVKSCASREVRCTASLLRSAALYLSEAQLEAALGPPADKRLGGFGHTSQWTVRVNDSGRLQDVKLIAAWGLCGDDKNYFATGQGQRACKISIE
jgi:hypothetical protein